MDAEHVRAVTEGFLSGSYTYAGHKSTKPESPLADVNVLSEGARKQDVQRAFEQAQALAEVVAVSRDWVNMPPNELTPIAFADAVVALTKKRKNGVQAEVFDTARLVELGCGGILGVGLGSANEPRLVKLTYTPPDATQHVALVGKGITYDSGGLTIKPGSSMTTMKCDMAGAAAIVAAIHAIADQEIPVAVTAWAPMAENMVSGTAMRPGDVLAMYGGRTVEIMNTDAEGRLILADALAMAAEEKPDTIVNVATLTGPCVVALGEKVAGLFGDDTTVAALETAASATGEMVWRLPIPEDIAEQVRNESKVADLLQHNWVRWGSALWAAAFLREFTGGLPWAHIDTAGPSYNTGGAWGHVPSGATGFATSTLVEYVAGLARDQA
jgi:leucyl aminopeptidase